MRVTSPGMKVLRLPDRGTLLISTDLQGNLGDFTRLMELLDAAGPDAWLVLTGDLVHGPSEAVALELDDAPPGPAAPRTFDHARWPNWPGVLGAPYHDESPALLDAFRAAHARTGGRVWCLLGNHDHGHIGGPHTSKFWHDETLALEARLDPVGVSKLRDTIREFPLVAVGACGVVLAHAAPSAEFDGPDDLEQLQLDGYDQMNFNDFTRVPIIGPLLWSRSARPEEAERFVKALGGEVAIYGHDIVREGYAKDGPRQLVVSTSFGLWNEDKTYVELDLAKRYRSTDDFREGVELKKLYG